MKFVIHLLLMLFFITSASCRKEEACPSGVIGNEVLIYEYYNDGTPRISSSPISKQGNIAFGTTYTVPVDAGIEIVIPSVRIRTDNDNFEIIGSKIEEQYKDDECYKVQYEFSDNESNYKTDIASVLVLDMSTSLNEVINNLKLYAREYIKFVVDRSPNSTVAVVFFSNRNAIQQTQFYTSSNIQELEQLINNYTLQEGTALFQAVQTGIDLLNGLNFEGEKSLVVFTDGGDNSSNNPSQLVNQINSSNVEIFAIGLNGQDFREQSLRSIVSKSSNFKVASDINSLQSIFRIIGLGVVSVYEFRYKRSDQLLSASESVKIRISFQTRKIE